MSSPGNGQGGGGTDLASRRLGGGVIWCEDDFFADAHTLIDPSPASHDPARFGPRGKIYDGWESRRRRTAGSDSVIVRLAAPGVIREVDIDTSHFDGNHPPFASVEGATLLGYATADDVRAAEWRPLVGSTAIEADAHNRIAVAAEPTIVTHVRLTIYPDGGVARLRVFGDVIPDPRRLGGRVDVASVLLGASIESCSNLRYAAPANVLAPGVARVMSDGWETSRRRDDGNDWLVVRLAAPAELHHVEIDTTCFLGNAPAAARLSEPGSDRELLGGTALIPDASQWFRLGHTSPVDTVRLDIYPDGGLSRLRVWGTVPAEAHAATAANWLRLLPANVRDTIDPQEFFA